MSTTKESPLERAVGEFKKAIGPQRYGLHGKPFVCQFCGHDRFKKRDQGVSMVGLSALRCVECSHVEFFVKMPPVLNDQAA